MSYKYKGFIPEQIAPKTAEKIGIYNSNGERIGTIPLGRLTPVKKEKLYSFGVISDIHLYPNKAVAWTPEVKFDNVLTYFEKEDCIMCVHAGDITQTGLYNEGDSVNLQPAQFAKYKEICDVHAIPVYGIMGNHESYVVPIANNLTELRTYTGTDLYYTIEPNLYDMFIFVGQPSGSVVMSDEAFQWLKETLEANKNKKRCFLFIHSYIEEDSGDAKDYRENSIFEYWGTNKKSAFIELLKKYENVILFHGHSHLKFECQKFDKSANYTTKNGFKSVHIPSLGRPRNIDISTGETPYADSEAQGYIIDVYDDCIVLNGMDLINNEYVPAGVFKIKTV